MEAVAGAIGPAEAVEADADSPARLRALAPDIVLNIATGAVGLSAAAHMPAILEMLALPYTGPGPLAAALCSHTARCRESLSHYGIPAPAFIVASNGEEDVECCFPFPVVVRPGGPADARREGRAEVAEDRESLARMVAGAARSGGAIIEEFIPGRGFSVVLLEGPDGTLRPLPVVETESAAADAAAMSLYSGVFGAGMEGRSGPVRLVCPADITESAAAALEKAAVDAATALGARDLCRVDIRFDAARVPRVLRVDPLPWVGSAGVWDSPLLLAAGEAGMDLEAVVRAVVDSALRRCGRGVDAGAAGREAARMAEN